MVFFLKKINIQASLALAGISQGNEKTWICISQFEYNVRFKVANTTDIPWMLIRNGMDALFISSYIGTYLSKVRRFSQSATGGLTKHFTNLRLTIRTPSLFWQK